MTALAFLLALGAIAFPAAWLVSAISRLALPAVRRLSPVARAEWSAWLALAPLVVAGALALAVSVPSALFGLGLGADHCLGHEHHPHLCAWHGALLPAGLALLGAAAWAAWAVQLGHVVLGVARTERLVRHLEALGHRLHGIQVVPSTVAVCHAVGFTRPKVLVSRSVVDRLDGPALRAVIAHERAHLERSDTRWSVLLACAECVTPFPSPWVALWRAAAEEAADELAALATDGPTVAAALVQVARMHLVEAPGFAFGAGDLERRVVRLLAPQVPPRRSRALLGTLGLLTLTLALVAAFHEQLHHEIEETWEFVAVD